MILLGTSSCMDCPTTEYELYTVTHALKLCPGARRGMRGTTKARNEFKYTIARPSFLLIYTTTSIHKTPLLTLVVNSGAISNWGERVVKVAVYPLPQSTMSRNLVYFVLLLCPALCMKLAGGQSGSKYNLIFIGKCIY